MPKLTSIDLIDALSNANVAAFLRMIRWGEGTYSAVGYRTMFGGETFESYDDHPRRKITKKHGNQTLTSTAAGAYQFLSKTWDGLVKQYGFHDFTPRNQDLGAVALIAGRGALQDVIEGRFETAVNKCAKEWASLPGSPYGQPTVTMDKARSIYLQNGGSEWDSKPSSAQQSPQSSQSSGRGSPANGSANQSTQQKPQGVTLNGLWSQIAKWLTRK
jgi:muramidase (phage lysozyme)